MSIGRWGSLLFWSVLISIFLIWMSQENTHYSPENSWKNMKPFSGEVNFWEKKDGMKNSWDKMIVSRKEFEEPIKPTEIIAIDPSSLVIQKEIPKSPERLPFRYVGRFKNGTKNVLFVAKKKKSISLKEGDTLDGYLLDKIYEEFACFIHSDSKKILKMSFSKGH